MKSMASASAVTGDSHFLEEQMNPSRIKQYLDSSRDYDKTKGMKWLLAMMSKGRDASDFFSDVVKNVVAKSVEVKKMVYMYLSHYCDFNHACREMALLSINSFQKDLAASNQLVRAMALRVMTSIRVSDIIQIQLLAVRKAAGDSSPYVRKCAANAVPKLFLLDPDQEDACHSVIEKLLKDSSTMVLGSAVGAFQEVCPHHWEIFHKSYRKLCHLLADVDEWAQITILGTLARYIRTQFADPAPGAREASVALAQRRSAAGAATARTRITRRTVKKAFYSDEEDESQEEEIDVGGAQDWGVMAQSGGSGDFGHSSFEATKEGAGDGEAHLDPDHRLALRSSLPLLKSRNSGVVLGVCALHYYCGVLGPATAATLGRALVRILRNRNEIQYVVLKSIASMAAARPGMFSPFINDFFVKGTDADFNREIKLEILVHIATPDTVDAILRELQGYVRGADKAFVCDAIRAAGRVADAQPAAADHVVKGLLALARAHDKPDCAPRDAAVVSAAVVVVRQLIQQGAGAAIDAAPPEKGGPLPRREVVRRLARCLLAPQPNGAFATGPSSAAREGARSDEDPRPTAAGRGAVARSNACWLVGEYRADVDELLPDCVRLLAARFAGEDPEVKQQILNLAVKAAVDRSDDARLRTLLRYVLELARFDLNHDLRDRGRYLTAVLGLKVSGSGAADEAALAALAEKTRALVLADKKPPLTLTGPVALEGRPDYVVGSLSAMVGHEVDGYLPLPDWPDVPPDPAARDPAPGQAPTTNYAQGISSDDVAANPGMYGGQPSGSGSSSSGSSDSDSDSDSSSGSGSGSDDDDDSSDDSGSGSGDDDDDDDESSGEASDDDDASSDESSSSEEAPAQAADPFDMLGTAAVAAAPATTAPGADLNKSILDMF